MKSAGSLYTALVKTIFLLPVFAVALSAADYTLGPDSLPQPGVPKGTVTRAQLPPGKFYPGTPHNYAIYVPAQYDAAKPTPFMIYMDGLGQVTGGAHMPVVFDNLIFKHELPPMIGIFIDPGVLPPLNGSAQSRFERVFEYDSLSDRFSRFLLEEVIPEVSKKYNLSKDPNDRGLSGQSTGAVAAFAAAWNRPDQFHRVLSYIGTYVAMKGADGLPALIRKTEPKPIRIFMQDGKYDHIVPDEPFGTFYAGSWPINNQVMYEAFQLAGYDVRFELGDGGHDGKQASASMPDALRWLWRGYPQPITVHEPAAMSKPGWDPRGKVYSTVWADKLWEPATPDGAPHDRRARTAKGGVYFTDPARRTVNYTEPSGKQRVVYSGGEIALPAGVALSPDQAMLIVSDAQSRFSWSFEITADGGLTNGEPFYRLELPESGWLSGVKAVTEDSIGQVYFATPLGIQVCEANGRVAEILNPPVYGAVDDVYFGGKDLNYIYASVGGKRYRRPSKITGNAVASPTKPPKPPL
jgi:enterochelin esterase-like enzyme